MTATEPEHPLYKEGIYSLNWTVYDVGDFRFTVDESEVMGDEVRIVLMVHHQDPFGLTEPTFTQIGIPRRYWDELVRMLPER